MQQSFLLLKTITVYIISFFGYPTLFPQELSTIDKNYISKNTQVQILISKTFLEDSFDIAEGFYDPRLGIVLYLSHTNTHISCLESVSNPECIKEKILKLRFLLNVRNILSKNQRVFLYIDYISGNKLEIWKKEFLDNLEANNLKLENLRFGYVYFINGKHPTLGEYPNWDKIQKIIQTVQAKFISLGMESAKGMFVPVIGFIFIIKTEHIPVKKVSKLNKKLIMQLRKTNISSQYLIEYFYGGKKGELSYFTQIENGKTSYLKFWFENEEFEK